jgi:hypothetical protein
MFLRTAHPIFLACALTLSALSTTNLLGEQAKVPPQHNLPPSEAFELFIPYWTAEAGWRSELQLRNNSNSDITVTPAIRTSDGTENPLTPDTIKAQEVRAIDIADAAPQLTGAYGSAVLRYNSPFARAIYSAVMVRSIGHPIAFHLDALAEAPDFDGATREGIWWTPNSTARDFLVLTNQGSTSINLDLSFFDAAGNEF